MIYKENDPQGSGISFAPLEPTAGRPSARFPQVMIGSPSTIHAPVTRSWTRWWKPALPLAVVSALLCLGVANITARATWREVEDGVLWVQRDGGVVAGEIAAGSAASRVGV